MPCPFSTTFNLVFGNLGDVIALSLTAPLYKQSTIQQVACSDTPVSSSSWWQGNLLVVSYHLAFRSLSNYLHSTLETKLLASEKDKPQKGGDGAKGEKESRKKQTQQLVQILAGCFSLVALYPLQYTVTNVLAGTAGSAVPVFDTEQSKSLQDYHRVYRGVGSMVMSFVLHQQFLHLLRNRFGQLSNKNWKKTFFWEQIALGSASSIAYPMETISRRKQVHVALGEATSDSLFGGLPIFLLRNSLCSGILMAYSSEVCQDVMRKVVMKFFH